MSCYPPCHHRGPKPLYKSVLKVVFVPQGTIEAKAVALQDLPHENADSFALHATIRKIALILSYSFSSQQLITSQVTALACAPSIPSHHLLSSTLTTFFNGLAFFTLPPRAPLHEFFFARSKLTVQICIGEFDESNVAIPPIKQTQMNTYTASRQICLVL